MEVKLVRSNKGGEKIFIDNFGYHFRSRNATNEYRWVCTYRKSMYCRSSVITKKIGDEHTISRPPTEHSHPKLEHEKTIRKYMKAFRKAKCTSKPALITENVSSTYNDGEMPLSLKIPLDNDGMSSIQNLPLVEREKDFSSNSNQMEDQSIDIKMSPNHRPRVISQKESDGTVNIRIFLEESLLSSFVINAHYTSNVNIRISKDDFQQDSSF